jgi:hypothetical protein
VTSKDYESLVSLLDHLESCDLTTWERNFVEDLQARLEECGVHTRISDAQQASLDKLERNYVD